MSLYLFLRQSIETFRTTGAILPSSPALGRAFANEVKKLAAKGPLRVVEVGAGTGPISKELVKILGPRDELDLVELNPQFAECLRQWVRNRKPGGPKIRVIETDVCLYEPKAPYDALVSGLPFNNFPPELVDRIFRQFVQLTHPEAPISFFEYLAIRPLKSVFLTSKKRGELRATAKQIEKWITRHEFRTDYVIANVPPASVHHLRVREREREIVEARV